MVIEGGVLKMDNYEAVAYAGIALAQLQKEGKEIKQDSLKGRMLALMDKYSEGDIYIKYEKEKNS